MIRPNRLRRRELSAGSAGRSAIAIGLTALTVTVAVAAQAPKQVPKRAQQPLQLATRAYLEGRYDEVDQLTDKSDGRDPSVVALKARAAIARGRYTQAEAAL